jgi:hypothetical protein
MMLEFGGGGVPLQYFSTEKKNTKKYYNPFFLGRGELFADSCFFFWGSRNPAPAKSER